MQGHIVVHGRVDAASPQPVGNRPEAEHPEAGGQGKAAQGNGGEKHAYYRDPAGGEPADKPLGGKAGADGAARDNHGDDTGGGKRHIKGNPHGRPSGSQQRVRQPQADKHKIDNG